MWRATRARRLATAACAAIEVILIVLAWTDWRLGLIFTPLALAILWIAWAMHGYCLTLDDEGLHRRDLLRRWRHLAWSDVDSVTFSVPKYSLWPSVTLARASAFGAIDLQMYEERRQLWWAIEERLVARGIAIPPALYRTKPALAR